MREKGRNCRIFYGTCGASRSKHAHLIQNQYSDADKFNIPLVRSRMQSTQNINFETK